MLVHEGHRILLGRKKRGVGEGFFNGFGGKVERGETIFEAAARELEEEAGIRPLDMEHRAVHIFKFSDRPEPWEVSGENLQMILELCLLENIERSCSTDNHSQD